MPLARFTSPPKQLYNWWLCGRGIASGLGRFADSLTSQGRTALSIEAIGEDTVMGSTAMVQETAFADLFEAAFLEESMSLDPMDEASAASTSINLLSLGPRPSAGCELTRQFLTGPGETSGPIRTSCLASNGLLPNIYRVRRCVGAGCS